MASVNKVILIGNLGRDPETRYTADGAAITNISLATTRKYKDSSGQQQVAAALVLGRVHREYRQDEEQAKHAQAEDRGKAQPRAQLVAGHPFGLHQGVE